MKLIVDSFNLIYRIKDLHGGLIFNFFQQLYYKINKYEIDEVYCVFDTNPLMKRKIDPNYKKDRGYSYDSFFEEVELIKRICGNLPKTYFIKEDGYEADDVIYSLCNNFSHPFVFSDDRDNIICFSVAPNLKLFRNKTLIHQYNLEKEYGFTTDKVILYIFLSGDSKDNILKPFKVKEGVEDAIKNYGSVQEYLEKNNLKTLEVKKYMELLFPLKILKLSGIIKGQKTEETSSIIKTYKISSFYESLFKKTTEIINESE